jgi:acetolactate synthase-1/2/3 large subunit
MNSDSRPIHPLRLCRAVREAIPDDAVLVVDGQEILNFARQSIPFRMPRSLNSGPFGMMGVGLPLGLGAKIALADAPVVILHGDGSFGLNAMEMDTAIRHGIPVTCIISNNGGWTANDRPKAGRDLGFTRYDLMFGPLGAYTDWIEDPGRLEPAITEAIASNRPAILNVKTDPRARAGGYNFTKYVT